MDQKQSHTWSVSWYGKAMYQISYEYLKAKKTKVRKTDNLWDIFLSPRAITLGKINGSKTKLKPDLYFGMAKQCTKYQMNICRQRKSAENCKIPQGV
jgi:hypothetical protein